MRRFFEWLGSHGRFPVLVIGAALASLVWLLVVTSTVTSPGRAREQRAEPQLPPPTATLIEQTLRQTAWHPCRRRSESVAVVVPVPPPGDRPVVTTITTAGTRVTTGTILARVAARPLIAVVTDAPLYRDLTLGVRGSDVLGVEKALAAVGMIDHADRVMDPATLTAWHRLDDTGASDRIRLDGIVAVPAAGRVTDVSAALGDSVKPGSSIMQVRSGSPFFECPARGLPGGLTPHDLQFEVDGDETAIAALEQRTDTGQRPGALRIRPKEDGSASDARVAVISADSGGPVLAAPLSAIRVAPDGSTSVVVIESRSPGTPGKEVAVTLGVTAQGLVAVTGDGLTPGTQIQLFGPDSTGTGVAAAGPEDSPVP